MVTTVIKNLLSRKQALVDQLRKTSAVDEREKIEGQLEQINTALHFLDKPEPKSGE